MNTRIPVLLKAPAFHQNYKMAVAMIDRSLEKGKFRYERLEVQLSERDLYMLYSHLPEPVLYSMVGQLAHQRLMFWIVKGRNVERRINKLRGYHLDPLQCAQGTWRRDLCTLLGERTIDLLDSHGDSKVVTHDNFVHAPSGDEVTTNLQVFCKYFV